MTAAAKARTGLWAARLGLLAGAAALWVSPGKAYWEMKLLAPQYPKGLHLAGYPDRIDGDVKEIDGLNHYIGMRPLGEAAVVERQYGIPVIRLLAGLLVLTAVYPSRWTALLLVPVFVFPAGFLGDLYYWLRHFGLNLDPDAPLNRSIKPFVPTILGEGKVGQFKTVAWAGPGLKLALAASGAVGLYWLALRSAVKAGRPARPVAERAREPAPVPVPIRAPAVVAAVLALMFVAAGAQAGTWVVRPGTPLADLPAAIKQAAAGDTIEVIGGTYTGPLVVDKRIRLVGRDWPVIDGHGEGTVVKLAAAGTHFEGFQVRGSGIRLANEDGDGGIQVTAPDVAVVGNRLDDVLFGVSLREAARGVVRGNVLRGKDLDIARRGDLIRLWWSHNVTVEDNDVGDGRDLVLWYSQDLTVRNNVVHRGRYGIHFMYCDNAKVVGNQFVGNSVGSFLMYSRRVTLEGNWIENNRGASGYGVGLKDMEGYTLRGNVIAGNRVGLFMENANGEAAGNVVAFNEKGVMIFTSCLRNAIRDNAFVENGEQVDVEGNTALATGNVWERNFWSDYRGLDADGDGFGDQAYRPVRLFERLTDRNSGLKLFADGPGAQAIDFSSRMFPIFQPQPKFTDLKPRMAPPPPPITRAPDRAPGTWILLAVGLMGVAVTGVGRWPVGLADRAARLIASVTPSAATAAVRVAGLSKRFGKTTVVDNLSFDVLPGEAVALWGPNGAGKTTLIKCLLGLHRFTGSAAIHGHPCGPRGKESRRLLGYVPQEVKLHPDQTVLECARFYARLRRVPVARATELLAEWGLGGVQARAVRDLSGGMRQKLALVLALLSDPPVLLLDEPTSNLDVGTREEFGRLLARLKAAGKTLVFCTHRAGEILGLADRVVLLQAGRKVEEGSPDELRHRLLKPAVLRLAVTAETRPQVVRVLEAAGYVVRADGGEVWVDVPAGRKADALARLHQAGVPPLDFDVESHRGFQGD
jgi:nitrous oxidase accessory protein